MNEKLSQFGGLSGAAIAQELLSQLEAERIKAVFATDKGWFIFNAVDGVMTIVPCKLSANSRIEIIATQNNWQDILLALNRCTVSSCSDLN